MVGRLRATPQHGVRRGSPQAASAEPPGAAFASWNGASSVPKEHSKKSAFPAKAGIHLSGDGAVEKWIPAFAGNASLFSWERHRSMRWEFGITRPLLWS